MRRGSFAANATNALLNMRMFALLTPFITRIFGKIGVKFFIGLAIALAIAAIATFVWFDIKRREEAAAQAAVTKLQLEQMKTQVKIIQQDQVNNARNQKLLNDRLSTIREDFQNRTNEIAKEDLGKIGSETPDLLEERINKATEEQLKRLEEATK